ncbi:cell division protein ZapA [Rhizobium sp. PAMB 3174]
MAQVTVTIDGKAYRMACEEGQEEHLTGLAGKFDRYVGHLRDQFGEIGDLRLTVMAGIMVMDELSEVSRRLEKLEAESLSLKSVRETALAETARSEAALAETIVEITSQINGLTSRLTSRPQGNVN